MSPAPDPPEPGPGSAERVEERIAVELLLELTADRAAGRALGLEHYLARFPGHAETVARVWLESSPIGDAPSDALAQVTPSAKGGRSLGRYRLLRELGRGGQGIVYLAEDERLARPVALKVLHPGITASDDARLRFQREAEVASRLVHPGLCTVYETGRADEVDFIAMRHVAGGSLAGAIQAAVEATDAGHPQVAEIPGSTAPPGTDRAAVLAVVALVEKAARALHAAHEHGVVHRDVKPSNILLDEDGEPVLVDFGLARDQSRAGFSLTASGEVFGTPEYMSPEQIRSGAYLDRRTDVYSLGVVLYKALALTTPFDAPTVEALVRRIQSPAPPKLRERVPGVPRDLEVVVATALEHDLARRYQSAEEFADDLARVRGLEPIHARRAGPLLRAVRWCQRNPVLATTGLLLILSISGVAALSTWFRSTADALTSERDEAIEGMTRLTDRRQSRALLERERNELWPVGPGLAVPCADWLEEARPLLARRSEHEGTLEQLRTRRGPDGRYASVDETILDDLLDETLANLEQLAEALARVEERRERSRSLARRSIEAHADAWQTCLEDLARDPRFGGGSSAAQAEFVPQIGLVPLGRNAAGYQEFWHIESGARPAFEEGVGATPREGDGLTLVLLPGGDFALGSHPSEGDRADPGTQLNEMPVHDVSLRPFFLSKFETTQSQWAAIHDGENPSTHQPGKEMVPGDFATWLHPVHDVSWLDVERAAHRLGLALPTEAQWEYACRAGTDSPFSFGSDPTAAAEYANFHAREANAFIGGNTEVDDYADRHARIAPVGAYLPNAFGLHDMHGNLWEWCRDRYAPYTSPVSGAAAEREADRGNEQRTIRGGCFQYPAFYGRSARRVPVAPETAAYDLGVRFARALDPASTD